MKLKRIVIRHFRNIDNKDLVVDNDDLVISGANMSGKTNTLNAIHWALTGVDLEGNSDNRANFPINKEVNEFEVRLLFEDGFHFVRECKMVDGVPTVTIVINAEIQKTVKVGEAQLHQKLGLTDFYINKINGFDITRFLLNPLYFETVAPKSLRQFFYKLANIDFVDIMAKQSKAVIETLKRYSNIEPYFLLGSIDTEKKALKKTIDVCKSSIGLFPEISGKAHELQMKTEKELKELEGRETLIQKYTLAVSKEINKYYQKAMGMKVCLLEKGVGDDVYNDVCYPILPKSNLPFSQGSYAEKTCMGIAFVSLVAKQYQIPTLPLLVDNMESLDYISNESLNEFIASNDAQYIGAKVQ